MMSRRVANVESVDNSRLTAGIQKLTTQFGPAINYTDLADQIAPGDMVLINRTANDLRLGTGGFDFVIARLDPPPADTPPSDPQYGHIMKLRYTPMQSSCRTSDDPVSMAGHESLAGFPVVCGELHSQIAPISAALRIGGLTTSYVMTDQAALYVGLSDLVSAMNVAGLVSSFFSIGQVMPMGDLCNPVVTLHNALLGSRWISGDNASIVCQGPGQTGNDNKYGFSGIEQAANLDIVAALGGTPIACIRVSSADERERHRGISHHTMTVLELVRSRVIVAVPEGLATPGGWNDRHDVRVTPRGETQKALDMLKELNINVTTMGRGIDQDELFFHAAAAAGIVALEIARSQIEGRLKVS